MNRINLIKRKGSPIYMRFVFNAGSRYDTKPGLAHFVEHMLVAGTEKFPTKDALAKYIEITGGSFSASTDQDFLRLNIEIAEKSDLDIAVDLIDQIFNHPLFDKKTIEKERGAIITELQKMRSNPGMCIRDIYKKLFFQNTPLKHPTVGNMKSIGSITKEDVVQFKEKYIRLDNVSVIVSGDIEEHLLLSQLEKINSNPNADEPSKTKLLPIYHDKKILAKHAPIEQTYFVFGTRIKPLSLAERAALSLMSVYLTGGRSGKLIEELRYKRGLIYNMGGNVVSREDWAAWTVSSSVNSKNLAETLSVIIENINKIRESTLPPETIEYLKSKIIKSHIIRLQSSQAIVENHENGFLITEQYDVEKYLEAIRKLTSEKVQEIFNQLIDPSHFFLSLYGSVSEADVKSLNFL